MTRRCSHCNSDGHNTRTCSTMAGGGGGGGGLRLFGVRLTNGSFIKKSASMGNLSHYSALASESPEGYHSDHPDHGSDARRRPIRNKGIPWTEEEHWKFLLGLQNLGKGDWRGISKNYVCSRTPTQVASHAQKYFIRQSNSNRKKKRTSLFDMVPDKDTKSSPSEKIICGSNKTFVRSSTSSSAGNIPNNNTLPCLDLSLKPAFTHYPLQLWPPNAYPHNIGDGAAGTRKVPAVVQDEPIKELVGMSHLTLGETAILQNESLTFSLSVAGNP